MTSRDRRTVAKGVAANIAVAGMLSVGAAVAGAAVAAADPAPPPPGPEAAPAPEFLTNTMLTPLAQAADGPMGPGGLPLGLFAGSDVPAPAGIDLLLAQHEIPSVQGPVGAPDMRFLDPSAALFPHNFKLPSQGLQTVYSQAPPDPDAQNPGLHDYLQGAHGLWHEGMGRMDQDQLGQPLPGTAPPPGTNLPAGPVDFLPDPPLPPGVPPPPGG